jgi:hypothetical protein
MGAASRVSRVPSAESIGFGDSTMYSLAPTLSRKIVDAVLLLLPEGLTRSGRHVIGVPPMSGDWLLQHTAESGKRGNVL